MEGRGLAKGNTTSKTRPGRRAGPGVPSALDRVREVARRDKEARFTALLHHVDLDRLRAAYWAIRPKAAPGVDGVTWEAYGQDLEANLRDLHAAAARGALPGEAIAQGVHPEGGRAAAAARHRRAGGQDRPAGRRRGAQRHLRGGLPRLLVRVPAGRSPHHALDALAVGIERKKVNWVLDADIRDFFTSLDHGWLVKFLEHRIADRRVLRLIQKWLSAGVIEDGRLVGRREEGAPQGAIGLAAARQRVPARVPRMRKRGRV